MIGFYAAAAARLADPVRCPAVLQVAPAMDAEATVETLALAADVTAIVSPLSDEAYPVSQAALMVTQVEDWTFGVTMAMVFPGGFAQFEPARDQIKAALRGWIPDGAAGPVQYAGGTLLEYAAKDGGRWLHLLRFRVRVHETYGAQS
ncbi:hypothetical protein [Caulobacter sp. BP25]|uniref:hypothetical protein n=1 Tax=Caulobacter sp. BP25 TaxID=2048900 RepID=UPI000C12AA4F|nr:hypothetical protein [Caulobacter sp. BP25]PHY20814.1 hypothetical protein CSW59_06210 [Caulobacter sp. BP25]